jgi:hypothetical protein
VLFVGMKYWYFPLLVKDVVVDFHLMTCELNSIQWRGNWLRHTLAWNRFRSEESWNPINEKDLLLEPTLCDQALRCAVGCVAHEIKGESVMRLLRQILCHVVGDVFFCRDVYDAELVLADTIANPMKPHVDCLAAFLLDSVVG